MSAIESLRRARVKRGPLYHYQQFSSFARAVGTAVIPLSPSGSLVCNVAVIQASLGNTGTVYIGGQEVTAGTGLELSAGQAILFSSSPPSPMDQKSMMASLGAGLMPYLQYMGTQGVPRETIAPQLPERFVIDLNMIFVTASAADQTLRVMYTQDITLP